MSATGMVPVTAGRADPLTHTLTERAEGDTERAGDGETDADDADGDGDDDDDDSDDKAGACDGDDGL